MSRARIDISRFAEPEAIVIEDTIPDAPMVDTVLHDNIATGIDTIAELRSVADELDTAATDREGLTTLEVTLIRRRVADIATNIPDVIEADVIVASQESFDHNTKASLRITIESLKDTIQKVWKWIVEQFKRMAIAIYEFIFGFERKLEQVVKAAKAWKQRLNNAKVKSGAVTTFGSKPILVAHPAQFGLTLPNHIDRSVMFKDSCDYLRILQDTFHYVEQLMVAGASVGGVTEELQHLSNVAILMAGESLTDPADLLQYKNETQALMATYEQSLEAFTAISDTKGGLFQYKNNTLRTIGMPGGRQIMIVAGPAVTNGNRVRRPPDEVLEAWRKLNITSIQATYEGDVPFAMQRLSIQEMDGVLTNVIATCALVSTYMAEIKDNASKIKALQNEIANRVQRINSDSPMADKYLLDIGLLSISKNMQFRQAYASIVGDGLKNIITLISLHSAPDSQ